VADSRWPVPVGPDRGFWPLDLKGKTDGSDQIWERFSPTLGFRSPGSMAAVQG
jgi:hypothetical protein